MKKLITLSISLVLAIASWAQAGNTDALESKIKEANEAKQYATVSRLCEQLLRSNPKNTYWLTIAGNAYFAQEKYAKAKEMYSLAVLYAEKKEAILYANLGAAYNYLNEDEKAYDNFRKGLAIEETLQTLFNAASGANNLHRYDECIKIMDDATITLEASFQSLYGRAYLHKAEPGKAIQYFENFLDNYDLKTAEIDVLDTMEERRNLLKAYSQDLAILAKDNTSGSPDWRQIEKRLAQQLQADKDDNSLRYLCDGAQLALHYRPEWKPHLEKILLINRDISPIRKTIVYYALNDFDRAGELSGNWLKKPPADAGMSDSIFMRFVPFARQLLIYTRSFKSDKNTDLPLLQKTAAAFASLLWEADDVKIGTDIVAHKMLCFAELAYAYIKSINDAEELKMAKKDMLAIVGKLVEACPDSNARNKLLKQFNL